MSEAIYKCHLLILLISYSLVLNGQSHPIEVGTEWYYDERVAFSPDVNSHKLIASRDTVINDISSIILERQVKSNFGITVLDPIIIHEDDHKVYRWLEGEFSLLYDFSLEVGEILSIPVHSNGTLDTAIFRVDSVRTIDVAGGERRSQYLTLMDSHNGYQFFGWTHEGIGSVSYFTPIFQLDCDASCPQGLRCFSNSKFLMNFTNAPCDTIGPLALGVSTFELLDQEISIYPNPCVKGSSLLIDFQKVDIGALEEFRMINVQGVSIPVPYVHDQTKIEIETNLLMPVIYFLTMITPSKAFTLERIVILD